MPLPYRADINLIPGMSFLLILYMIVIAFQWSVGDIAGPVAANADPGPPMPNEIVLRIHASGMMELSVDDEWGTRNGWAGYRQPRTFDELERDLRRHYANRTEDRVLILKADTAVSFGVIDQVIRAARDAGVRVLRAVVETKGRE